MGGGKGGTASAPPAPDPAYVSQQQTQSNVNTAIANAALGNVNQRTPQGNLTYNQVGTQRVGDQDVPRYEAVTQLSPEMQRIYDSQMGVQQGVTDLARNYTDRIGQATSQPFSYDGMPAAPGAPQYSEAERQRSLAAIEARNAPAMQRDQDALIQRLANQGVGMGSEAWRTGFDDYNRGVNDFRLGADIQAGGDAARQFQLQSEGFRMQGDARSRAIQEALALRNQPINEVSALLGTGGGVQMPQFQQTQPGGIEPTDVAGNYNAKTVADLAAWKQGQAGQQAGLGGLFGLAGTLGGAALRSPWIGKLF